MDDDANQRSNHTKYLGKRIRELRRRKFMTQKALAQKVGVSIPAISYYEKGRFGPRRDRMKKLCAALEVSMADLLEDV